MKKNIFLLAIFLFATPLAAQIPYWHQTNGPEAGTLVDVSIDSSGRIIVWTAGSGAYRSTDNENSWELLNRGLPKAALYGGAATRSGFLFAFNAAADGQLFRFDENDPNAKWVEVTPFADTAGITVNEVITDPNGTIYLATGNGGVLRSDDNGATWLKKGQLLDTVVLHPLIIDQSVFLLSLDGNGNLYAGLNAKGAIFRSSDKGDTWKKLPARCPGGQKALTTMVAAPNGNIIIGTDHPINFSIGGRIYVSTDQGQTWDTVYRRPTTDEGNKNNIDKIIRVPGTNLLYANTHGPTLRSTDFGMTWNAMDLIKRGDERFSMAGKGTNLFQLSEPDGIFLSTDSGANWTPKNNGIYAAYMYGVAINSKQAVFAITEYGLWGTTDNGDTWDHKPEYGEDYHPSLFINKKDHIFIGTSKGLLRSIDDGQTLKRIIIHVIDSTVNDSLNPNIINQVGDDGHGKLFCASNVDTIGFLYSTDDGDHWIKMSNLPQLPPQQQIYAFAFASQDTILASTGIQSFYLSTDNGDNWRLVDDNSKVPASQLLIHPNGAYLARVQAGTTGGIFRSDDGAHTWKRIFPAADQTPFNTYFYMMIDHTGNIIVCTDSGVYRSKNSSFSEWYSISEGLSSHDVPGHFISCVGVAENPVTHVFFAASHGLGVFRSIPNLDTTLGSVAASPVVPELLRTYPNPSVAPVTISLLSSQSMEGSLELYDILGRKIKTIYGGVFDSGENIFPMDGSALPSGSYMLVLHSGAENITSWITIAK